MGNSRSSPAQHGCEHRRRSKGAGYAESHRSGFFGPTRVLHQVVVYSKVFHDNNLKVSILY